MTDGRTNFLRLTEKKKNQLGVLLVGSGSATPAQRIKNDDHIMNMSIRNVIKLWSKNNIDILVDITKFFSNFKKYNKYFDDIDETKMWFDGLKLIVYDLFVIFTKEKRIIFIGITLLLLSFGLYIIQITS